MRTHWTEWAVVAKTNDRDVTSLYEGTSRLAAFEAFVVDARLPDETGRRIRSREVTAWKDEEQWGVW